MRGLKWCCRRATRKRGSRIPYGMRGLKYDKRVRPDLHYRSYPIWDTCIEMVRFWTAVFWFIAHFTWHMSVWSVNLWIFDHTTRVACGFPVGFFAGWKFCTDLICICRVPALYLHRASMCAEADRKRMVLSTIHVSQAHIFEKQSRCRESGSSVSTVAPVPGFFLFCILCTILLLLHSYKCS